jgi:hypothetical protein
VVEVDVCIRECGTFKFSGFGIFKLGRINCHLNFTDNITIDDETKPNN